MNPPERFISFLQVIGQLFLAPTEYVDDGAIGNPAAGIISGGYQCSPILFLNIS
jgi:hypothetical protein